MAPNKEEEHKLKEFKEDSVIKVGSAEKFLRAVLEIPFAFKRVEAMLYIANFDSEVNFLKKSFETLEVNLGLSKEVIFPCHLNYCSICCIFVDQVAKMDSCKFVVFYCLNFLLYCSFFGLCAAVALVSTGS